MAPVSWRPYLVEDGDFLSLQFDEDDVQSRMRKSAPNELVLSYTHAMVAFMLFLEAPRDIVIAGLGGGSLSKFCFHQLPAARITTVEISQAVIDLRDRFCIPPDDDRFQVVHADFSAWLAGREQVADVILLDGFDSRGIPASLRGDEFLVCCRRALRPDGMLLANINLGITEDSRPEREQFNAVVGPTVSIRSTAGHNDILIAFRRRALPELKLLKPRARALAATTGIDFPLLLDKIRSAEADM